MAGETGARAPAEHRSYRPDIDGLRAVAVLSVFAFHLLPHRFPAGGIGVDVFFVISGFLIGGILLKEAEGGSVSLVRFYARRFRRIAPALLVTILATTVIGLILSFPLSLVDQSWAAVAALLSVSNFYFLAKIDYFDQEAAMQPLLHTWSLGIEEQFYLAAPLCIIALQRYAPRHRAIVLSALLIASFAISVWRVEHTPSAAFYAPDSRAWELLMGVMLNLIPAAALQRQLWRELAAVLGAVGLLASYALLRPIEGFPGWQALGPCVATSLLLVAGRNGTTRIGRLLSLKPVVFVGLISYSLYLWHWPAIVFTRDYLAVSSSKHGVIPISVAIAFVLAILSWRFVEGPFRATGSRIPIFRFVAVSTGVLAALQLAIVALDGLPARFPADALRYANLKLRPDRHGSACLDLDGDGLATFERAGCLRVDPARRNILLIGDSHAGMLRSALESASGSNVLMLGAPACNVDRYLDESGPRCARGVHQALTQKVAGLPIDRIVLNARWENLDPAAFRRLLTGLKAIAPVMVIGPTPEFEMPVPKLIALSKVRGEPTLMAERLRQEPFAADRIVAEQARASGATYVSAIDVLCPSGTCRTTYEGRSIYVDRDHLTPEGASLLVRTLGGDHALLGGGAAPGR